MQVASSKIIVFMILIIQSCVAQKSESGYGVLKGNIGIYEGNCMPSPGVKPCVPRLTSVPILITTLAERYDEALLVKRLKSNENGEYKIQLPEGEYSLFLEDEGEVICTLIQCPDACLCHPFQIVSDSTTVIDANLDHANW